MVLKLPEKVDIVEVGPRDGFQSIKNFIPTENKLMVLDALISAEIKQIEITSFVSPKAIPQLADSAIVTRNMVEKYADSVKFSALAPNLKGAQAAWEAGLKEIAYVVSVSEAHNKANINRTHEASLSELAKIRQNLPDLTIRVDLATALACPFVGWIEPEQVIFLAKKIVDLDVESLVLADTIGVATPIRVYNLVRQMKEIFAKCEISLHLHDTRGMGLANTLAGLQGGVTTFETSIGGLGGCPFAPGAAGNTATEDVVNMLEEMGIKTGIDRDKILNAAKLAEEKTLVTLTTSHMSKAKIYEWQA